MKLAWIDAEFTGETIDTTLVSLAIVGQGDEKLSVSFSDYDRGQVSPWLQANVLNLIDESKSVTCAQGFREVSRWLEAYSQGEPISLVSAGKLSDILLLFELWRYAEPRVTPFHYLHCLPGYLNHAAHFDLHTIFWLAGIDPNINREEFIAGSISGTRHDALYDALVVRECFRKAVNGANFPKLQATNRGVAAGSPR